MRGCCGLLQTTSVTGATDGFRQRAFEQAVAKYTRQPPPTPYPVYFGGGGIVGGPPTWLGTERHTWAGAGITITLTCTLAAGVGGGVTGKRHARTATTTAAAAQRVAGDGR